VECCAEEIAVGGLGITNFKGGVTFMFFQDPTEASVSVSKDMIRLVPTIRKSRRKDGVSPRGDLSADLR